MNRLLFASADFLSKPPGFWWMSAGMCALTVLAWIGQVNVSTFILSVLAIIVTSVVLLQGSRDTTAMHAKLDEIVVSLAAARNSVIGLEHRDAEEIERERARTEQAAG